MDSLPKSRLNTDFACICCFFFAINIPRSFFGRANTFQTSHIIAVFPIKFKKMTERAKKREAAFAASRKGLKARWDSFC